MYIAKIFITLRKTILDPQGKAVEHSLKSLGYNQILDTRIGKLIELKIDTTDKSEAERISKEASEKLLANPVMEDFEIQIYKGDS